MKQTTPPRGHGEPGILRLSPGGRSPPRSVAPLPARAHQPDLPGCPHVRPPGPGPLPAVSRSPEPSFLLVPWVSWAAYGTFDLTKCVTLFFPSSTGGVLPPPHCGSPHMWDRAQAPEPLSLWQFSLSGVGRPEEPWGLSHCRTLSCLPRPSKITCSRSILPPGPGDTQGHIGLGLREGICLC